MPKFKFPLLNKKPMHFPDEAVCPWCQQSKVFEPHSFAVLSGGACLKDPENDSAGPSEQMDGFLDFTWHGAHDGGLGDRPETGGMLEIVTDVSGGQFELYFCSTKCLRAFLNYCVDELEANIE